MKLRLFIFAFLSLGVCCFGMQRKLEEKPFTSSILQQLAQGKTVSRDAKRDIYIADCERFSYLNNQIQQHNPQKTLRIMTYNLEQWRFKKNSFDDIMQVIGAVKPDIICCQETLFPSQQAKQIMNFFTDAGYVYGGYSDAYIETANSFGNVIFSKYPLKNIVTKLYDTQAPEEDRGYVGATIMFDNVPIRIYCTHLDVFDDTEQARLAEMKELFASIEKNDQKIDNVMILGDFNAVRKQDYQYTVNGKKVWDLVIADDKARKVTTPTLLDDYLLTQPYVDSYALTKKKPPFTVWSGKIVDFIYCKPTMTLKCDDCSVYFASASDHLPVIADFSLPPQRKKSI